jgi:hypothetical protein
VLSKPLKGTWGRASSELILLAEHHDQAGVRGVEERDSLVKRLGALPQRVWAGAPMLIRQGCATQQERLLGR